jgi:hypothetical protein
VAFVENIDVISNFAYYVAWTLVLNVQKFVTKPPEIQIAWTVYLKSIGCFIQMAWAFAK